MINSFSFLFFFSFCFFFNLFLSYCHYHYLVIFLLSLILAKILIIGMISLIKSILIHEYQHGSTRINTSQHESTEVLHQSTRVNTSPTRINTSQHESDTNQRESTRVQHESTRVSRSPTQVNKIKKVKQTLVFARRVNASQQKSDMSLTWIWESIINWRNISGEVFIYDFSGKTSALYLTAKVSSQMFYWICLLFTLAWSLHIGQELWRNAFLAFFK